MVFYNKETVKHLKQLTEWTIQLLNLQLLWQPLEKFIRKN